MTRRVAVVRGCQMKSVGGAGAPTVDAATAVLDKEWRRKLADAGVQPVGEGLGLPVWRDHVIRHDRPGDYPADYPFEVIRTVTVTDADVPAHVAARIDPRKPDCEIAAALDPWNDYVPYDDDTEETP